MAEVETTTPITQHSSSENEIFESLPVLGHYVDNAKFSKAVQDHNNRCKQAELDEKPLPRVGNYIGECFMKMAEGMSMKYNFIGYSWKEEMVADGVEHCLKYIRNFDIETQTRTGEPNAFYYFSTIIYWAFVRRIKKENKQTEIKHKMISSVNIYDFITDDDGEITSNNESSNTYSAYVEDVVQKKMMP